MALAGGTVGDACVWCKAMHGMHGQEQSQEQINQNGALQSFSPSLTLASPSLLLAAP